VRLLFFADLPKLKSATSRGRTRPRSNELTPDVHLAEDEIARRADCPVAGDFNPGPAALIDGSVSTQRPDISRRPSQRTVSLNAFLVGPRRPPIGAGSAWIHEAFVDDGAEYRRGHPLMRDSRVWRANACHRETNPLVHTSVI